MLYVIFVCDILPSMNTIRTIACKLAPSSAQRAELDATLVAFADACNFIADVARQMHSSNKVKVQHACYAEVRTRFGLSANLAIRAIARVCAALKVPSKAHSTFQPTSIDYDQRICSFREWDWTFSLTLLHSRERIEPVLTREQKRILAKAHILEAALVKQPDGRFFVQVKCEASLTEPAPAPRTKTQRRHERLAQGLCVYCGKEESRPEKRSCEHCADIRKQEMRSIRQQRKTASQCHRCGQSAQAGNVCLKCWFMLVSSNTTKGTVPGATLHQLLIAQEFRCAYTGKPLVPADNASLDHKTPVSRGGTHDLGNLQWIDSQINRMKTDMTHEEFLAMCQLIAQASPIVGPVDAGPRNPVEGINKPRHFSGSGS